MAEVPVEVTIPALLADCTGGRSTFEIAAITVADALDRMRRTYPLLRRHLFDESGVLREHLVIFYNERNIRRLESLDTPLKPGDRIVVLQAVSGG